jgi:glycosyltransferase involved in cell wall biosynthesis
MSNLRVLYSFPLWIMHTGGVPTTGYHQVSGLVKSGVQVILCCGAILDPIKGLHSQRETLKFVGLKLPLGLLGTRRSAALHDRIVARNLPRIHKKDRIDIVHCWPSGALETLKVARELGIKTVLERPNAHTRYAMEVVGRECERLGVTLPKSHSHAFNAYALKREEEEFELADCLLCPSEFVAQTFLEKGFSRTKIARHQYGFDPTRFRVSVDDLARVDERPFSMVFVGSCEPRKGLHYALDAWLASKACKNGTFYICGKYIPGYRKLLADRLAHPSIKDVGFLANVAPLMQNCHALVLPTIEEGFGLVTCEARACGCVLLVSNAASEACEHMKTGLVHKVGNVDTLRQHIDLLASDKELFSQIRNNSLATVHELTWDKAAESLIRAYQECLSPTE